MQVYIRTGRFTHPIEIPLDETVTLRQLCPQAYRFRLGEQVITSLTQLSQGDVIAAQDVLSYPSLINWNNIYLVAATLNGGLGWVSNFLNGINPADTTFDRGVENYPGAQSLVQTDLEVMLEEIEDEDWSPCQNEAFLCDDYADTLPNNLRVNCYGSDIHPERPCNSMTAGSSPSCGITFDVLTWKGPNRNDVIQYVTSCEGNLLAIQIRDRAVLAGLSDSFCSLGTASTWTLCSYFDLEIEPSMRARQVIQQALQVCKNVWRFEHEDWEGREE